MRILMKQERTKDSARLLAWAVLTMNSQLSSSTGYILRKLFHGGVLRGFSKPLSLRSIGASQAIGWNTSKTWPT